MNRPRPRYGFAHAGLVAALRPHAIPAGMAATAALVLLLLTLLPRALFLPVLSLALLLAASLLALIAWRVRVKQHAERITLWDICGACAFIGFAAAILSNPENVLTAFAPAAGG